MPLGDVYTNPLHYWGLTPFWRIRFGASVIKECNRLGILIDLAHANMQTMEAAIKRHDPAGHHLPYRAKTHSAKADFSEKRLEIGDQKSIGSRGKSFTGHPGAMFFEHDF